MERMIYGNITFNMMTPAGRATIIIAEESPGVIYKIFFNIGKAGTEVNAACYAIAELVTFALHKGASIEDMVSLLSNITSSRPVFDSDGIACRSVPEALYLTLLRYKRFANKATEKVTQKEHRPPRFNHSIHG